MYYYCCLQVVRNLRIAMPQPIAIGFGVSGPEQVRQVKGFGADASIVGSALVKRIAAASSGEEISVASQFCLELSKAT